MTTLVLFSSANKQGHTQQLVADLATQNTFEIIDIDELNITAYNYQNTYPKDDFYSLIERIVAAKEVLFATPVYWSGVTAPMKNFIDRITELCDVSALKAKARALENKPVSVITTSASEHVCPIFEGFFRALFDYFNMNYITTVHLNCRQGYYLSPEMLRVFKAQLKH